LSAISETVGPLSSQAVASPPVRQDRGWNASIIGSVEEFRPVLEVHRVEVLPLATPNEAILLENLHDLERQAIPIARALRAPQPLVGEFGIYIAADALPAF